MSGVVLYSPEEARRNTFSVTKFHTLLGAELHTPDYDGPADFVINRTNDPAVARRFESQGVRVFNPAAFCALANDKDACYRFMAAKGVEILPIDQTEPPMVVKPMLLDDRVTLMTVISEDLLSRGQAGKIKPKVPACPRARR